jgi:response regulator RpfG family c-di-GMP phosphodiesterase
MTPSGKEPSALVPMAAAGGVNDQEVDPVFSAEVCAESILYTRQRPTHRILIVDDEPGIRAVCRRALRTDGFECEEAANGFLALDAVQKNKYDLVLLDIDMPGMKGPEICQHLRANPPCPHLKIVLLSGRATSDEMAQILLTGADDYLTKPLGLGPFRARVKAALRLKDAQDRASLLNQHLLRTNQELEQTLHTRDGDLIHARNALVLALAKLVECRDLETGSHLLRLQHYSRCLAEEAAKTPAFAGQIDRNFIQMLECCTPLHDIGKVGLPDHILLKPGKLEPHERLIMQSHTVMGADTLKAVAAQYGSAMAFLQMATDIARHHHEWFDGRGYPDRLSGSDIPLSARLVAISDVYDALRSRRVYKPAFSHALTLQKMNEESAGHFDPALYRVFQRCADNFQRIFHDLSDE